jgi:DNA-binding protein WhiA
VNADGANLLRTARAAHVQLEAIRALDLAALPAGLSEIAELRLRHPSASLRELAAKSRPPITKAAAHRRLRALVRRAETT